MKRRNLHRKDSRVIAGLLSLLLLCGCFLPLGVNAEAGGVEYGYGYSFLQNDAQRYVYERLVLGIDALEEEIPMDSSLGVTVEDLQLADEMYRNDYPTVFWYRGGSTISLLGDTVSAIRPQYVLGDQPVTAGSSELIAARAALATAVDAFFAELPADCVGDTERALWIHDRLAGTVTYAYGAHDQTAYGALVEGRAVCAGYARAYQLLLLRAGIPAFTVYGTSENPTTGSPENHAWTLSFPEGSCHYSDLTWDDQGEELYHVYFQRSLDYFAESHTPTEEYAALLPACTHDPLDWFATADGVGILDDSTTGAAAAAVFPPLSIEGEEGRATAVFLYNGSDFSAWMNDHRTALAEALGLTGTVHFSYKSMDNEYHLTVRGRPRDIPLTGIALLPTHLTVTQPGEVILETVLTPQNATERGFVWSSSDDSIAYVLQGGRLYPASNGTVTITVATADGRLSATCQVTVAMTVETLSELTVEAIPRPVAGGKPQAAARISDLTGVISVLWEVSADGSEASYREMQEGERFTADAHYRARIYLVTPPDRVLAEDCVAGYVGGTATLVRHSEHTASLTVSFGAATESEVYRVDYFAGTDAELASGIPTEYPTDGALLIPPPHPYAEGKVFLGWFTNAERTEVWDFATTPIEGNLLLFAGWREATAQDHRHDVESTPIPGAAASCTAPGRAEAYRCHLCGALFLDAEGKFRISTEENLINAPQLEHSFFSFEAASGGHYAACDCGLRAEGGVLLPHLDENRDGRCDDCGYSLPPAGGASSGGNSTPGGSDPGLPTLPEWLNSRTLMMGGFVLVVLLLLGIIVSLLRKKK